MGCAHASSRLSVAAHAEGDVGQQESQWSTLFTYKRHEPHSHSIVASDPPTKMITYIRPQ